VAQSLHVKAYEEALPARRQRREPHQNHHGGKGKDPPHPPAGGRHQRYGRQQEVQRRHRHSPRAEGKDGGLRHRHCLTAGRAGSEGKPGLAEGPERARAAGTPAARAGCPLRLSGRSY